MRNIFGRNKKFYFVFLVILALISSAVITLIIHFSRASDQSLDARVNSAKEKKYVANQLLIKLDVASSKKFKSAKPTPLDTGIPELDAKNKKLKVSQIERLYSGPENETLNRWLLITFKGGKTEKKGDKEDIEADLDGVSGVKVSALEEMYRTMEVVEEAEINQVLEISKVPNDMYYSSTQLFKNRRDLWGLEKINAESAWDKVTGGDVLVAVVDTGVDYNHPDLKQSIYRDSTGKIVGYDFHNNDNDPMDDHFHGTHVAGTIGGIGDNDTNHNSDSGTRVVGVAWNVKIMPIKTFGSNGSAASDRVLNGLKYAADKGAKIINNSWGGGKSPYFDDIIKYCYDKGSLNIFAAGNSGGDVADYDPAGNSYAITVGATNYMDKLASFSNFGGDVDVVAPGGDSASRGGIDDYILSTRLDNATAIGPTLGNSYAIARGTSMATPHVAGAAALIMALRPEYSLEEVRAALRMSADKVDGVDFNEKTAHGRINIGSAVNLPSVPVAKMHFVEPVIFMADATTLPVNGVVGARAGMKSWVLEIAPDKSDSWKLITSGTTAKTGLIGNFNSSGFGSGRYFLRLSTTDNNNQVARDYKLINIDYELMAGWPKNTSTMSTPIIADLNGDGKNEIILGNDYTGKLNVIDTSGASLPGFPVEKYLTANAVDNLGRAVTVEDINGDGKKEIITVNTYAYYTDSNANGAVIVYGSDGKMLPGWPKEIDSSKINFSQKNYATVADIDGDGKKEIFVNGWTTGKVYGFRHDGTNIPGWPATTKLSLTRDTFTVSSSVAVFDTNGDGRMEIFAGNFDGTIYGFNANGTSLPGWPQNPDSGAMRASLAAADINGDGKMEIIAKSAPLTGGGSGVTNTYAYTIDGKKLWSRSYQFPSENPGAGSFAFVDYIKGGGKEIYMAGGSMSDQPLYAYGFNGDGTNIPGWPVGQVGSNYAAPAIADLTGDGVPEIINTRNLTARGLAILSLDGKIIMEKGYDGSFGSASVGDIDGDGKLEVIAVLRYKLYAWKFKSSNVKPNEIPWGQYMKDARHTATYTDQVADPNPDTTKPSASITSPQNGATVSGNVKLQATASDDRGVAKVEFYRGTELIGSSSAAPYEVSWDTGSVVNGSYILSARAYDYAGNVGTSPNVTVQVSNTTTPRDVEAPTVSITSPANETILARRQKITITASASDNVGVTKVEFYINSKRVSTVSQSPYSMGWTAPNRKNATYQVQAVAYDAAGNRGFSTLINIYVR